MKALIPLAAAMILAAAPALAQPSAGSMIERLKEADANGDGAITREEFLNYRAAQFDRLDRNHDGVLTADDRPRMAGFGGGQTRGSMLEQFDANQDGRVDKSEYVNGPTPLFDRIDANHDGVITAAELQAARAQGAGGR